MISRGTLTNPVFRTGKCDSITTTRYFFTIMIIKLWFYLTIIRKHEFEGIFRC